MTDPIAWFYGRPVEWRIAIVLTFAVALLIAVVLVVSEVRGRRIARDEQRVRDEAAHLPLARTPLTAQDRAEIKEDQRHVRLADGAGEI